ncbi:MAG: hypothetical protein WBI20_00560 [Burkholderiaceae bacterium]
MYLIAIAWIYVALMMAVAEATHANGTVFGALVTFFLYGVAPCALVLYLMGAPQRRSALKAKEAAESAASTQADASRHPAADPVAPVREKP